MKLQLLTILAVILLLTLGCGGASPTQPTSDLASLPSWDVTIDGHTFTVDMAKMVTQRSTAVDFPPGTGMTAEELRIYFAWNIAISNVPEVYWCPVYDVMYGHFQAFPDTLLYMFVGNIEQYEDIPAFLPPNIPDC